MRWDIFCRVIDNHGDLGVCWRLAADLAARGESVRLWVDDPVALAWMAPQGAAGVVVIRWIDPLPNFAPGDVVIEAFGCDPPPAFVAAMATATPPPVWINLEYLSAESYVERSHGLPSPMRHGSGLVKWFYFPGLTAATGGLLRERDALWRAEGLTEWGLARRPDERVVSVFAYADAPFGDLFARLGDQPTLLLLAAGASQAPAMASVASVHCRQALRVHALPWLSQTGYDRLLRACDLNFARGEDSIVRAMWAAAPFVWQIYGQSDGAHAAKLQAMVERITADSDAPLADAVGQVWRAWNGLGAWPEQLPALDAWAALSREWRERLIGQTDLTTQLLRFVAAKR